MKTLKKVLKMCTDIYNEPGTGYVIKNNTDYCEIKVEDLVCYITFRGTDNKNGWASNLRFWDRNKNGIMDGFEEGFNAIAEHVISYVDSLNDHYIISAVQCSGHSRGGALAIKMIKAFWDYRKIYREYDLSCITFGTPRVQDAEQREIFNRTPIWCTRVEVPGDPVCDVPLRAMGYRKEGNILKLKTPWWWNLGTLPVIRAWKHHPKVYMKAIEYTERKQ